ncbi:hypothetical protein ACOSP7_003818 [Xanthoceras sorbifolium]
MKKLLFCDEEEVSDSDEEEAAMKKRRAIKGIHEACDEQEACDGGIQNLKHNKRVLQFIILCQPRKMTKLTL